MSGASTQKNTAEPNMTSFYRINGKIYRAEENPRKGRKVYVVFFEDQLMGVHLTHEAALAHKRRGVEKYEGHGWYTDSYTIGKEYYP